MLSAGCADVTGDRAAGPEDVCLPVRSFCLPCSLCPPCGAPWETGQPACPWCRLRAWDRPWLTSEVSCSLGQALGS